MNITMIGTGYVGLVSAACFAEMGQIVTCLDIDEKKIAMLNSGHIPIFEPFLEEMVKKNAQAKRLFFTLDADLAMKNANVCFLAVPTESSITGDADLIPLYKALDTISIHINQPTLIVIKSTVPVGTTFEAKKYLNAKLKELNKGFTCEVAFNPEFLKEGSAVNDFMKPDRVIIGSENLEAIATLKKIYHAYTFSRDRILTMSSNSAEMTKYAANVMLASRISLMNEFANFCEKTGASIHDVRVGIGADLRIGYRFLYAGLGYGGSCFPKDIKALKAQMQAKGCSHQMIDAIEAVNTKQRHLMKDKVMQHFKELKGLTFTLLGLSFKPETDDIRQAPALTIIDELLQEGCYLKLFDPIAMPHVEKKLGHQKNVTFCEDEYQAIKDSHAILLITEWKQFRQLDFVKIKTLMKNLAVFDGRNQYQRQELEKLGFYYEGFGA